MPLPTVRNFIAGEIETAAYMNSLGAVAAFLLNPPRTQVYNSTGPSIPNNVATVLTFDSEVYDTDNLHNPVTNPSRLTPQTAGLYVVTGQIAFAGNATGIRQAAINLNGTQVAAFNPPGAAATNNHVPVRKEIYFNGSSDYVELTAYQNSGVALSLSAGAGYTFFTARWVANS